jgi:hypothetical protein
MVSRWFLNAGVFNSLAEMPCWFVKKGHTPFEMQPFQSSLGKLDYISMPPIPPPIPGWPLSSDGASAIMQSIVSIKEATEEIRNRSNFAGEYFVYYNAWLFACV